MHILNARYLYAFLRPSIVGSTVYAPVPNSTRIWALQPAAVGQRKQQSFATFSMYLSLVLRIYLSEKVHSKQCGKYVVYTPLRYNFLKSFSFLFPVGYIWQSLRTYPLSHRRQSHHNLYGQQIFINDINLGLPVRKIPLLL